MPNVYGQNYTRNEVERRVGAMDQLAGIRAATMSDGRARGTRILHVHTGSGLEFTAAVDRCLDIFDFRFNGRSLAWHSGTGVVAPAFYEHDGPNWLRSFFGGMVTTCGLGNVGAPGEDEGRAYGLHGRIANSPAENVSWGAEWHGDDYVLWIRGDIRDARVFGPRLVLRRHISTALGSSTVVIEDTVENEGFEDEPFLLLYHTNGGFPLLDDGSEVRINGAVSAFDDAARQDMANWTRATAPRHAVPEQVFIHDVEEDADGFAQAELLNPRLGLGYRIRFRKAELPHLWQWKMMGERDYVMGLEPCNCAPGGRAVARQSGDLGHLPPRGFVTHRIELEAFETKDG
jgi:hypothetical protein